MRQAIRRSADDSAKHKKLAAAAGLALIAVDFTLYSPYAGRVQVHYSPGRILRVATQREIRVRTGVGGPALLQIKRLDSEAGGLGKGQ